MAEFVRADLHGSRFERVDLAGGELRAVNPSGAVFRYAERDLALLEARHLDII